MNKAELVSELANRTKSTQVEAKAFLDAFTDTVGDVLKSGDKILEINRINIDNLNYDEILKLLKMLFGFKIL